MHLLRPPHLAQPKWHPHGPSQGTDATGPPSSHLAPACLALHVCQLAFPRCTEALHGGRCALRGIWVGALPCGTHPGAGPILLPCSAHRGRSAPARAGRGSAYIKPNPPGKTCLGYLQCLAGRCAVGAIFGRCRSVSSLDAAASCPQCRPSGRDAELAAPQPRRTSIPPPWPHTTL